MKYYPSDEELESYMPKGNIEASIDIYNYALDSIRNEFCPNCGTRTKDIRVDRLICKECKNIWKSIDKK